MHHYFFVGGWLDLAIKNFVAICILPVGLGSGLSPRCDPFVDLRIISLFVTTINIKQ